jgi:Na+:H+ antiporter, NhaA family
LTPDRYPAVVEYDVSVSGPVRQDWPSHAPPPPFRELTQIARTGALLTACATLVALVWANSPWSDAYFRLWGRPLPVGLGDVVITKSVHRWLGDVGVTLFVLLCGLELKREVLTSRLPSSRWLIAAVCAALGGMFCSATTYEVINLARSSGHEWVIPVAADAVAVLGVLSLRGASFDAVTAGFVAAVALLTNVAAALLVAVPLNGDVAEGQLLLAVGLLAIAGACNLAGVRQPIVYALLATAAWLTLVASGIQPVVVGALFALAVPARPRIDEGMLDAEAERALRLLGATPASLAPPPYTTRSQQLSLLALRRAVARTSSPAARIAHTLRRPVLLFAVPLFVLANAGVHLDTVFLHTISPRIALGVFVALLVGKATGVALGLALARYAGADDPLSEPPPGIAVRIGWICGLGLAPAIYLADLTFGPSAELDSAKIAIIAASALALLAASHVTPLELRPLDRTRPRRALRGTAPVGATALREGT